MKFVILISIALSSCYETKITPIDTILKKGQSYSFDQNGNYKIGKNDKLTLIVHENDNLNAEMNVTGSGHIIHPLFTIQAEGKTTDKLRKEIAHRLQRYARNPIFRLELSEPRNLRAYISGEIKNPGRYQFSETINLVDLIALAGGPTDYFSGQIILIRRHPDDTKRYIFNYEELIKGDHDLDKLSLERNDHFYLR
jgi:polysaccharide export outer membrane protein